MPADDPPPNPAPADEAEADPDDGKLTPKQVGIFDHARAELDRSNDKALLRLRDDTSRLLHSFEDKRTAIISQRRRLIEIIDGDLQAQTGVVHKLEELAGNARKIRDPLAERFRQANLSVEEEAELMVETYRADLKDRIKNNAVVRLSEASRAFLEEWWKEGHHGKLVTADEIQKEGE
jgi:hypothetical protein